MYSYKKLFYTVELLVRPYMVDINGVSGYIIVKAKYKPRKFTEFFGFRNSISTFLGKNTEWCNLPSYIVCNASESKMLYEVWYKVINMLKESKLKGFIVDDT